MGDEQRFEEANSRYERWVAMWAAGVRASGPPMALGDPTTARFIELSPAAIELVGQATNYLDIVEPQEASGQLLRLMRDGLIEGARTRRRLRRVDGSLVDIDAIGWVVRSPDGPDLGLGLWLADPAAGHGGGSQDVLTPAFPKQDGARPRGDRLLLDESWRIQEVRANADRVAGRARSELLNGSFLDWIHPDDLPTLLFALARATTDSIARALVRVCDPDGAWRSVEIAPAVVSDEDRALIALVVVAENDPAGGLPRTSITAIPSELRRIADHIETAAVMAPLAELTDALGLAAAEDLSPRQWEVVRRLVRGERVSTIASEMYLSRSTIRNHLTAIFAKVGVHSQEELLTMCHRRREGLPPR